MRKSSGKKSKTPTIPPPFGQILAGINSGLAIANVGKILATKFDGGGGGSTSIDAGGGGASTPNLGSGLNTSAPSIPQQQNQQSTQYNNGQQQPIEAYVVETKSRSVTERVDKIVKQSEY